MGWVWKNDDDDDSSGGGVPEIGDSSNPNGDGGRYATRKVVRSQCRTEEVEPGKFIRKCEKTEQLFKDCVGRSSEMVQSNKEYSEEDVTEQMVKGLFPLESEEGEREPPSYFPGLRSDIEALERRYLGRFFEAAEEMKKELFNSVRVPHMFDDNSDKIKKHEIPIDGKKAFTNKKDYDGDVDFFGLATDV